ncbi:MAG: GNAT family N-acetyltransferase [Proteobacteria bacterium]|nr:GNAT family N-acetyltransferase [Pseudomonadota bacterium]
MKDIETLNLLLRRPTEADSLILGNLWRNELVRTFLGGVLPDEIIAEKVIALQSHWDKHQFGLCAALDKNNKEVIGLCGPHYSEEGIVEISYMFFPQLWGRGFAKEAVIASIDYIFRVLKVDAIIAITQEANLKSCYLLEKIGMQHINKFERYNATQRTYRITHNEWQYMMKPNEVLMSAVLGESNESD